MEQQVLDVIYRIYQTIGWPGVLLLMTIESACIPLPSEIIMPLAGWILIRNQSLGPQYVFMAGALGALGCLVGSIATYWLGKAGGRPVLEKYGKYVLVTHYDLDVADHWFSRYGNLSVFISRLLPVVRTFIRLPAGVAVMNFGKFLVYTFIGSFIWCVGLAYAGYLLGGHWEQISSAMRPATPAIVAVIVVLIAFYIYRHVRHLRTS